MRSTSTNSENAVTMTTVNGSLAKVMPTAVMIKSINRITDIDIIKRVNFKWLLYPKKIIIPYVLLVIPQLA